MYRFLNKNTNCFKMKRHTLPLLAHLCALAALAPAYAQIYDWKFETSDPTDVNWSDIVWNKTETTEVRDRFYIDINNSTSSTVKIAGGETVEMPTDASLYLKNYAKLVIGDAEGSDISTLHFVATGSKDTFLEITGSSSIVVNKNGVLTMDANRPIRWWSPSNTVAADFVAFMVDGGTVNGNISIGANGSNFGNVNVVFKNGATLNRNTEVNPLGMNGLGTLTFDNSTYNVWNINNLSTNNGWGNHSMNTSQDNQNYQNSVTITNGAVWNGAGVLVLDGDSNVTGVDYYDFSSDITNSGMSGVDLTLQVGRATSEDSFFKFEIANGGKVSAKNVILGAQDNTKSQHTMGSFSFEMGGDSAENVAVLAAFGSTVWNLARTNADSTWNTNFSMKGNAKYQTVGAFDIARNEDFGGTANFSMTGDNNVFQIGGNLNVKGGWNHENVSEIKINLSTAEATNSIFQANGMNVYSHGNSQIDIDFLGQTNTFSLNNYDLNMYSSKIEGDSVASVEIGVGEFATGKNFTLSNNLSGRQELVFSNGVNASISSATFSQSDSEGGDAVSYYVIKDGSTLTTNNDNGYNVQNGAMRSGEVGIMLLGDGSSFISKGQMNINPGNEGNTGGTYAIRMLGTNGTFEAQKNLHLNGLFQGESAMYLFEMQGSGNTANVNTFNLGNNNSTAGTYRFFSKSDSAENKNNLLITNTTIALEGQMVESTAVREFIMAGNTTLRTNTGDGVVLKVHEYAGKEYLGGTGLFEVRGSGNDALFSELKFGNGVASGGTAIMRIVGGGSSIETRTFRMMGGAETSLENPVGGVLEYKFDDTGISAIKITNNIENSFNGILSVDFSGMSGTYDNERFVLMTSADTSLESKISEYWFDFQNQEALDKMKIVPREVEGESYVFAVEDSLENAGYKDFVVYYTASSAVPEPSTYAAILGALALAFAAYRRRA